ncbi:Helitron helicase [Phytophthora megakarya]|uniref:ATP-dependent DNA helicase n=1 Tax=Phytophthora megakarya TaxID=4795 RepID=A0A225WC21_9STRA|nr:Helitron helicase [Phytophthora megakarya]
MFRIPLKPNEHATCGISKQTQKVNLIRQAQLIIWDEAPMMHRGDHRHILPVLKDATRAEILKACFKASPLWRHLKKIRLFENMRVRTTPDPDDAAKLAEFSELLLQIDEGRFPVNHEGNICLPRDMCVFPEIHYPPVEFPNFTLLRDDEGYDPCDDPEPVDDRRLRTVNALIDAVHLGLEMKIYQINNLWIVRLWGQQMPGESMKW